ncbi:unnamed protein product, partial [Closterium sp. Naga37s-1]
MHSSVVASILLLSRCSLHLLSYFLSLPLSPPLPAPSPPPSTHLLSLYPSPSSNANSMGVEWCYASLARHSTLVRSFTGSTLHSGEKLHLARHSTLVRSFTGSTPHSGEKLHWLDTPL